MLFFWKFELFLDILFLNFYENVELFLYIFLNFYALFFWKFELFVDILFLNFYENFSYFFQLLLNCFSNF